MSFLVFPDVLPFLSARDNHYSWLEHFLSLSFSYQLALSFENLSSKYKPTYVRKGLIGWRKHKLNIPCHILPSASLRNNSCLLWGNKWTRSQLNPGKYRAYQDGASGRYERLARFWIPDKNMVREIGLLCILCLPVYLFIFLYLYVFIYKQTYLLLTVYSCGLTHFLEPVQLGGSCFQFLPMCRECRRCMLLLGGRLKSK